MNKVLVKYRGNLEALTGIREETLEASDIKGLLISLRKSHGIEAEKTARTMLIALNGESIQFLKQYKTALREGDTVSFFPLCAGG